MRSQTAIEASPVPACRVLVIDDDDAGATSLAELLRWIGHDVGVMRERAGALRVIEAVRPDLVVLDVDAPGACGYLIARQLRDRGIDDVMLVASTRTRSPELPLRARCAGFDRSMIAPASLGELREILAETALRRTR